MRNIKERTWWKTWQFFRCCCRISWVSVHFAISIFSHQLNRTYTCNWMKYDFVINKTFCGIVYFGLLLDRHWNTIINSIIFIVSMVQEHNESISLRRLQKDVYPMKQKEKTCIQYKHWTKKKHWFSAASVCLVTIASWKTHKE